MEQTVSTRLTLDADEFKKELDASGKVADQLAGDIEGMGGKIDRVFSGLVGSAGDAEQGIRSLDSRLGELTGAERGVVIQANVSQAEAGIRQIDQMLSDPKLTETEIRIALDARNEASQQIEKLKGELGELGEEGREAAAEIERGFDGMAIAGAVAGAGINEAISSSVESAGLLRAQLRLTTDEAEEFNATALRVYRDNFGGSLGEVTALVALLVQSLRLQGDELEGTAVGVFRISDAFEAVGADTQILVENLRILRAAWPGLDEERSLDLITNALQMGTGNAGDLLDTIQEYAPIFADMGFSADDMFLILNEGMKNGARNTDFLADAFKELGIRIQTEGDTGQQAIAKLFPADEADRLIADFSRGGDAARGAFQTIAAALVDVKDPQDQYNLAVELFGTKAEDLSTSLIPTLSGALEGLASSTDTAKGANESLDEQYTGLRNTLEGVIRVLQTSVVGGFGSDLAANFAESSTAIVTLGLAAKGSGVSLTGLSSKLGLVARGVGGLAIGIGAIYLVKEGLDALGLSAQGLQIDLEKTSRAATDDLVDSFQDLESSSALGGESLDLFSELAEGAYGTAVRLRDGLADAGRETGDLDAILRDAADGERQLATDAETASGVLEDGTPIIQDVAEETETLAQQINAVTDAYRAQIDPLFAAQDAMLGHRDAQEAVHDAQVAVMVATGQLDDAIRDHGRESDEARDATANLTDAERDLESKQRDVIRSAMDVTTATFELKRMMEEGEVSTEGAKNMLSKWVDQGLLTEEQAADAARELGFVAGAAREADGLSVHIPLTLESQQFWAELARARYAVALTQVDAQLGGARTAGQQLAAGGLVTDDPMYLASGGGPRGTDTVPAWLTPGEFVVNASAVSALGVDTMRALNKAHMVSGVSGGSSTTTTDSRSVVLNTYYPTPEPVAESAVRALRKVKLAMG